MLPSILELFSIVPNAIFGYSDRCFASVPLIFFKTLHIYLSEQKFWLMCLSSWRIKHCNTMSRVSKKTHGHLRRGHFVLSPFCPCSFPTRRDHLRNVCATPSQHDPQHQFFYLFLSHSLFYTYICIFTMLADK